MSKAKYTCCAPECRSGRAGCFDIVNWHSMKDQWVTYFPDVSWKYSASSKLCSKHFQEADYKSESTDTNITRKKENTEGLRKKILKAHAIPSVWPNIPTDKLRALPIVRPTDMSSAEARRLSAERLASEKDKISNLEEIIERKFDIPASFHKIWEDGAVLFVKIDTTEGIPKVTLLKIVESLNFQLWCGDELLSIKSVVYGIDQEPTIINSYSLLSRILFSIDKRPDTETVERKIEKIVAKVKCLFPDNKKADFMCEQLQLLPKKPLARRYSNSLLAMSCMWVHVSHALYLQIQEVLIIPQDKYAQRLSGSLKVDFDLSDATMVYLKLRKVTLKPKDLNVNVILDEVYTQQSVQYENGTFYGNEGNIITKTMLSVMLKSVAGGYRDVVTMSPITNISSEKVYEVWKNVVKRTTELEFNVVATTSDNHNSNMKFFKTHLCGGTLKPFIMNPFALGNKIFLLFDATHLLKCIYHNFRSKQSFVVPPFDCVGPNKYPSFANIEQLHNLEIGAPIKYAHKLSDKVISPLALEKTNVSLATAVFDESTINALTYYGKNGLPCFDDTAEFVQIIKNWWDLLNVKSTWKGKHKRNHFMEKIDKNNITEVRAYLNKFAAWIKKWREDFPEFGLTNPTFKALLQTTTAIIELTEYLIESDNNIGYVLLGFLQQDFLEGRFGWWRQLAGGNYFCSVLQFLQAEKSIRLRNLVKDGYNLKDIKHAFEDTEDEKDELLQKQAVLFLEMLMEFDFSSLARDDKPITYYVAGYISRRLIKRTKCQDCHVLFSKNQESITVQIDSRDATDEDIRAGDEFIDTISRGGLIKPSELLNIVSAHANDLCKFVKKNSELVKYLLSSANSRSLFTKTFVSKLKESPATSPILESKCKSGHTFAQYVPLISNAIFNMFAKNFAAEANSQIHKDRKRKKTASDTDNDDLAQKRDPSLMKQNKLRSTK